MTCDMQTNVQTNNNHSKQNIYNLETDGWGLMACLQGQVQLPLQMEGLCHIPNFGPIKISLSKPKIGFGFGSADLCTYITFPKPQDSQNMYLFFKCKKGLNPSLQKEVCQS